MKRKIEILSLTFAALLLTACDSNKEKAKNIAEDFISAFNKKDKVTIYDMFPKIKDYKNLLIADSVNIKGDISVDFDDVDSVYVVTLGDNSQQKILMKKKGDDDLSISDCYNIFSLDSIATELALKTGVPLKKISDIEKSNLFNPDDDFIKYLSEKNPDAATGYISIEGGSTNWSRSFYGNNCTLQFGIRNTGKQVINAEDYNIEVSLYERLSGEYLKTVTVTGEQLSPGERTEATVYVPELYSYAYYGHGLYWAYRILLKDMTTTDCLGRYGSFTGNEYEYYAQKMDSVAKAIPESAVQGNFALKGKISKYEIQMVLSVKGSDVEGSYYYVSKGASNTLSLSGEINKGRRMKISERDENNNITGSFSGIFDGKSYKGTFTTPQGKSMNFELSKK